jgi:hypothetical protein
MTSLGNAKNSDLEIYFWKNVKKIAKEIITMDGCNKPQGVGILNWIIWSELTKATNMKGNIAK